MVGGGVPGACRSSVVPPAAAVPAATVVPAAAVVPAAVAPTAIASLVTGRIVVTAVGGVALTGVGVLVGDQRRPLIVPPVVVVVVAEAVKAGAIEVADVRELGVGLDVAHDAERRPPRA